MKKTPGNSILHQLINKERRRRGLPWVRWHQGMYGFAKDHSNDMAKEGRQFHSEPHDLDGGVECVACRNRGTFTPSAILECFLSSPAHSALIMGYDIKIEGIGISFSKYGTYVTWVGGYDH